jgi:hypothetical protein
MERHDALLDVLVSEAPFLEHDMRHGEAMSNSRSERTRVREYVPIDERCS